MAWVYTGNILNLSMISIQAKKHDNFSIEFKLGYNKIEKLGKSDFLVRAWIFIPNSLDINPEIYGKDQFYRDLKSNVRLITPVFSTDDLAQATSIPFLLLESAKQNFIEHPDKKHSDDYEYHIKMFSAIFKSSIRNRIYEIFRNTTQKGRDYDILMFIKETRLITSRFRKIINEIKVRNISEYISARSEYADEFISAILEDKSLRLLDICQSSKIQLSEYILEINSYRKSKQYCIINDDPVNNRNTVFRIGMLKKYIESDLYVGLDKKRDGFAAEQLYYSIAAGVAMVFATGVAWATQVKYGNITTPLFIVLVISYMLKDRIKDLMRYFFSRKFVSRYFDKKASVSTGKIIVGNIKEGVDFIPYDRVTPDIIKMRNSSSTIDDESRIFEEKILLYKKHITIYNKKLLRDNRYPLSGLNEIMRLHLVRFTQKMDNPEISAEYMLQNGNLLNTHIEKLYYLNIIFELESHNQNLFKHFRIAMTRNGIIKIQES